MQLLILTFSSICLALLLNGCQGQSFSADAGQAPVRETTPATGTKPVNENATPVDTSSSTEVQEEFKAMSHKEAKDVLLEDGDLSDDDEKILGCIDEWGTIGVSKSALAGYRRLTTSSEGFASGVIKDVKTTAESRLVLVKASATGFAGAHIELLNPKGWYCIDVANVGFSSARILMHCEAEEAGMVQKNVGFSSTQVTRVGC